MTDDKRLPKGDRKRLQVEHAPRLSPGAGQIKLADKYCNVRDITEDPPVNWSMEQKQEYLLWAQQVVSGLRGINPALEKTFDDLLEYALNKADAAGAGPLPGE